MEKAKEEGWFRTRTIARRHCSSANGFETSHSTYDWEMDFALCSSMPTSSAAW